MATSPSPNSEGVGCCDEREVSRDGFGAESLELSSLGQGSPPPLFAIALQLLKW